jgi:hypothetical protein
MNWQLKTLIPPARRPSASSVSSRTAFPVPSVTLTSCAASYDDYHAVCSSPVTDPVWQGWLRAPVIV